MYMALAHNSSDVRGYITKPIYLANNNPTCEITNRNVPVLVHSARYWMVSFEVDIFLDIVLKYVLNIAY